MSSMLDHRHPINIAMMEEGIISEGQPDCIDALPSMQSFPKLG
jgi:hypothetical protein